MKTNLTLATLGLSLALTGCKSIGPGQVGADRFDYSSAIADSWKTQTLLNIVKVRYIDTPIYVDVSQIVASRSLQTSLSGSVGQNFYNGSAPPGVILNNFGFSAGGTYSYSPTVTFTPLTGAKYIQSMMTPLAPESVVYMIQSGWPADVTLALTVASINGLKNEETSLNGTTTPEPAFLRVIALMRRVQESGGVTLRMEVDAQKNSTTIFSFPRHYVSAETEADCVELRRLLRLNQNANDFNLVFGVTAANDREIALQTLSISQLLNTLAAQVEVPAQDLTEHYVFPGWESAPGMTDAMRMIKIHSSKNFPANAFVAVPYNGYWFWIDKGDLKSKRTFSFLMGLYTLADMSEKPPLPIVTIPAH